MINHEEIYDYLTMEKSLFIKMYGEEGYAYYEGKKNPANIKQAIELKKNAQAAILEGDKKTAYNCYMEVLNEYIGDSEAKYFVISITLLNGKAESYFAYSILGDAFIATLQENYDEAKRRQMAKIMIPELAALSYKMVELDKSSSTPVWGRSVIETYRKLSRRIDSVTVLGNSPESLALAVQVWKDAVYLRHSFCAYRNAEDKDKETWYDEVIKNIQKYDPSYEAPKIKQPGCLMVGEEAKSALRAKPGM